MIELFPITYLRIVIFQVGVELPIDSDEADEENKTDDGRTLLNILHRGCILPALCIFSFFIQSLTLCCRRDAIGDSVVAGDLRIFEQRV